MFFFLNSIAFSQKDCNKKVDHSVDEYDGTESVESAFIKIIDQSGKHLLNELINSDDKVADWALHMEFMYSDSGIYLFLLHNSLGYPSGVDGIDFKFVDGSTLLLDKGWSGDRIEDGPYNSIIFTHFDLTQDILTNFSNKIVEKVRVSFGNLPRESIVEKEITEKVSELIRSVAVCFEKNLPNPLPLKTKLVQKSAGASRNEINNNSIRVVNENNSIFRNWKLAAIFNSSDGSPLDLIESRIIKFNEDGTFESSLIKENGEREDQIGTFKLLNNNKVILFTTETNKSYSWVISRLINGELEIKNSQHTSLYLVEEK